MTPRPTWLPLTLLVPLLSVLPAAAAAQPLLSGTTTPINGGAGDQIDPHVDCNLASYTDDQGAVQSIRYFDFTTNSDAAIPTSGLALLSDVLGSRVVFTNVTVAGSQIVVFDTSPPTGFTTIPGGTQRTNASIGGDLVAFEDRSFSSNPNESEIVVYNLATGVTTRLTNDVFMDVHPVVTPAGDAVVFTKCQTTGLGCDIYVARQTSPGVFVTGPITGPAGEDGNPDTNGTVVVYETIRGSEADIEFQPVAGGIQTRLSLAGQQRNPSIAGHLLSFESYMPEGNFDLYVYDLTSKMLHRVTQTPVDETLSDITLCGGQARVVYSAPGGGGDFDVFAFTFAPPTSVVPFAALGARLWIHLGREVADDAFAVRATFRLDPASNGIAPLAETVTLHIGAVVVTIPAGSFRQDRRGRFGFAGVVGGVAIVAQIRPLPERRFELTAAGWRADLSGVPNPVTVGLSIGNDGGSTMVAVEFW